MTAKTLASICDRCGREMKLGSTKYQAYIEITSAFDGYLPEPAPGETLAKLVEESASLDEETLDKQIHIELNLTVCPRCRRDILETLGGEDGTLVGVKRKSRTRLQ